MSNVVPLTLGDGSTRILVETELEAPTKLEVVDRKGEPRPDRSRTKVSLEIPDARFKQAVEVLTRAAGELFEGVKGLPSAPTSCEVTFGVKFTAQLDAILAKSSGEANFTVKLTWAEPRGPKT